MKHFFHILTICCILLSSCAIQHQVEPKRYDTLSQKANVSLEFDQHKYILGSTIQLWRNELIILSIQPMKGVEMARIEATPDSILLVDKLNRRYTTLPYDFLGKQLVPEPSFKLLQQFITIPTKQQKKEKNKQEFTINQHRIAIECTFLQREYNTLDTPRRINLKKYKQVSLREIIPL